MIKSEVNNNKKAGATFSTQTAKEASKKVLYQYLS
jgi:hypothetical protein